MPTCEGGYKAFKIGELFDAATGNTDIQKNHIDGLGEYVISSGTFNNGIIGKSSIAARIFAKNTITIDMFGNVYFHPYPYKIVTHARIFSLSPKGFALNETSGLYFVSAFSYLKHLFSYNNMCSWEKIKELAIYLPSTIYGEVDFAFMEQWVRGLEEERVREIQEEHNRKLKAYLQAAGFDDCTLDKHECEVLQLLMGGVIRSKKVKASELFDIQGNPQLNKESFVFGEQSSYPYFTRTVFNNGILGYVDYLDDSHLIRGNSLAIGMMGMQFFYMQHDFYAGQFTKTAFPKFNALNEYIALYFITQLNKMKGVYLSVLVRDFEKVFNNTELSLPITASGEIDYAFMETAIRAMEKQCIARLKDRFMQEEKVYRQVIH